MFARQPTDVKCQTSQIIRFPLSFFATPISGKPVDVQWRLTHSSVFCAPELLRKLQFRFRIRRIFNVFFSQTLFFSQTFQSDNDSINRTKGIPWTRLSSYARLPPMAGSPPILRLISSTG
jgi:hypothetical protein